jgi:hypothetical protein
MMKKIAYYISNGFFYAFSLFFIFVFVFSILAFVEYNLDWDIPFVDIRQETFHDYATIKIPILELNVGFVFSFIIAVVMWIGFLFYTIYFYALKEFFNVFNKENTFSQDSIKKLKLFLWLNLIVVIYGLIWTIVESIKLSQFKFDEALFLLLVHGFIALIVYLYMDVFKKGSKSQEENDLTI